MESQIGGLSKFKNYTFHVNKWKVRLVDCQSLKTHTFHVNKWKVRLVDCQSLKTHTFHDNNWKVRLVDCLSLKTIHFTYIRMNGKEIWNILNENNYFFSVTGH